MREPKLKDTLRPIVLKYGFEKIERCLKDMESTDRRLGGVKRSKRSETSSRKITTTKTEKKGSKISASEYVSKMDIPSDRAQVIGELARKFDRKSFLPTIGDIGNFCQVYVIEQLTSKSRANAIPRIFKFIATMETDDIRIMLEDGMYSGPSRLGPIADAIRSTAKHRATSRSSVPQTGTSSTQRRSMETDTTLNDYGSTLGPTAPGHINEDSEDSERDRPADHHRP